MSTAFVLMTAMPPTIGHKALIEYASFVADKVQVIVCTQPGEPFVTSRVDALRRSVQSKRITINHKHRDLPQEPSGFPGFWGMWGGFLKEYGFREGDFIVASEDYGVRLAQEVNGVFIPFDLERNIVKAKATWVRNNPYLHYKTILPEFRHNLKKKITIFGAESVGKTTLARAVAKKMPLAQFYPEWARPYLETVGPEVTYDKMEDIWDGQKALQRYADSNVEEMLSIQDTDLFSTLGYWKNWRPGTVPNDLEIDAVNLQSDLYIMLPSTIPFEADPLRYGGDKRETEDRYWIEILSEYDLPFVIPDGRDPSKWVNLAVGEIADLLPINFNNPLQYNRVGN